MAEQQISNRTLCGAPGATGTTAQSEVTTPWSPSYANLGTLYNLPPEVRILIYQMVMDAEDATPTVHTLVYSWPQRGFYIQSCHGRHLRPPAWGLLGAVPEALSEALRRGWVRLPARLVMFPGASVAHVDLGSRDQPLVSRAAGHRLLNPAATVLFMDCSSLMGLLNAVAVGLVAPANRFAWLTDLTVDRRTFEHLLALLPRPPPPPPRSSGGGGGGRPDDHLPFPALPGLRRLVVGFLYRWQDVAVVEGPYHQVVEEMRVDIRYASSSSNDDDDNGDEPIIEDVDVRLTRQVHPILQLMITETILHTASSVRALNRAGIRVTWAVIWQGVTRRRDIIVGPLYASR